jgi:hypothetical protein
VTYLITFSTYGSHLHGDARGSVDPKHNQVGSRLIGERPGLERFERSEMTQAPYLLDDQSRAMVLEAIKGVCEFRGWYLFAVHARSNHVHVVVDVECSSERAAADFKAYASRALNRARLNAVRRKRWTRYSSIRLLASPEARERAIHYVAVNQGEPMALFVAGWRAP